MKRMTLAAGLLVVTASVAVAITSLDLLKEPGLTPYTKEFAVPPTVEKGTELLVRGENSSNDIVTLVVRIDDGQSVDYASRVNEERRLPPGPFTVRFSLDNLRTPSKRPLDMNDIRRVIIFTGSDDPEIKIDRLELDKPIILPKGAFGWDFGPKDGPVFPGFEPVTPVDPRLFGHNIYSVRRPIHDPLIADGLNRVERFTVKLENGPWRVSLWLDDTGEWETLPRSLQRRVKVNGETVLYTKMTDDEWTDRVYLAGRASEAVINGEPWQVFGARRGGMISIETLVTEGTLTVELAGSGATSTYLAGMLAEQGTESVALDSVHTERALRFMETWRVASVVKGRTARKLELWSVPFGTDIAPDSVPVNTDVLPQQVAVPDSLTVFDFLARAPKIGSADWYIVDPSGPGGTTLPVEMRFGHWRFERPNTAATLLVPEPVHLRADGDGLPLMTDMPRRINLRVIVPKDAKPGLYEGMLTVTKGNETVSRPFAVRVLPIELPPADLPVGVYLDHSSQWNQKSEQGQQSSKEALACDLTYLRALGLSGMAPPLATPDPWHGDDFMAEFIEADSHGFVSPLF
ncbi:MAG: hypothetical protein U9N14_03465, partial [Pseudomonadota bacterium]|nr:hypothetical protein [Pseudomonadota bacterium]